MARFRKDPEMLGVNGVVVRPGDEVSVAIVTVRVKYKFFKSLK